MLSRALACVRAASGAVCVHSPPAGVARTSRVLKAQTKKARSSISARATTSFITPSILRPRVPAGDRLRSWVSPHTFDFGAAHSQLAPPKYMSQLFITLLDSLAPDTQKNYGSGLLRFHQFCDEISVSETLRMPASEVLLSLFCASWAGRISRSTVNGWLDGLRFWHIFHGAPWYGGESALMLSQVKKGVSKMVPETSKRPPRPPVTIAHMHALFKGLDLTNSFDAAVWAVAAVAFWCCCRLGELVIPAASKFDPAYHVSRGAHVQFRSTPNGKEHASFQVPWTKTTGFNGAKIIGVDNGNIISPTLALRHHLRANSSVPDTAPMFAYETSSSSWAPLTRGAFLARCNSVWRTAGLGELTGHCFRIGGATEYLLQGVAPDVVQVLGRWRSQAFLDYWRKIEDILPIFLSGEALTSRLSLLRSSMETFRINNRLPK